MKASEVKPGVRVIAGTIEAREYIVLDRSGRGEQCGGWWERLAAADEWWLQDAETGAVGEYARPEEMEPA